MTDPSGPDDTGPADLARYVSAALPADQPFIDKSWAAAVLLVDKTIDGKPVPGDARHRACLEVGADLFFRRQTRNGVAGFADADLNPYRVSRDPLAGGRPILAPWLGGGFA